MIAHDGKIMRALVRLAALAVAAAPAFALPVCGERSTRERERSAAGEGALRES
jgi:hypothetical protein